MALQGLMTNQGIWCYRCRTCREVFTSSQGLAGHQCKHIFHGTWVRGAPHDKFFCPSTHLTALYLQLGNRKSTPTVLPGQGRFYRPRQRNSVVHEPHRFYGRPQSVFDLSQQQTMVQLNQNIALAARYLESVDSSNIITVTADWMDVKEINDRQEIDQELDLELRL
ncbi:hypothetical protein HAX54_026697 [Datura stramonium]|uniref:C2H2-type domain-containing protein n=1 Tax=Datura stramonium TaxID=4076 RepID=A0ABS8Y7V7_DATST|nr:hypothetical protein [Datura stramonium]